MFLSRLLTPAEQNYRATELEVSCIVWAVRKLRHMIEAAPEDLLLVAYTNHIATTNLAVSLSTVSPDRLNKRLVQASPYLQQFRILIHHRAGRTNCVAGAQSRLPAKSPTAPDKEDDLDALAAWTDDLSDDTYAFMLSTVEMNFASSNLVDSSMGRFHTLYCDH
ncbi:hypothetical protein N7486_010929 [Penicillium sp. IBT 16267x]|nr:hypothetical protein N7486_010929 [Penicillium sp. IBT 16267x]